MSLNFSLFQKPSRYIGNEFNIIRKDADMKVALCFPDTYEIGMSHLGLKILYSIINNIPNASAERVFAPWVDYESFLREKGLPLVSLENNRPLNHFDIAGFTLQYELSYTNVLNMMDLGGIPIKANDRGDNFPLIFAGGPCAVNPLPLSPFIDVFVVGDGEEVITEIIAICSKYRLENPGQDKSAPGFSKKNFLLKALSELEGVYIPSVHNTEQQKIKRRIVRNLDKAPFPGKPLVPFHPIVHDRATIEISRGCTRGCRFCQAGIIYRPLRERSLETVLSLSNQSIKNTGYDEISFTSLSTGDYSNLFPLIKTFNNLCSGQHIAVSLPSLRVGTISREVLKEIKSIRKTGFTIAPEAGTKRLRSVINKDFTEEEYEDTLEKLFTEGWQKIKLYFMIGLPTESREDIEAIIHMAEKALQKGKKITGKRVNINVGISAFVPKPHTPFQWLGQAPYGDLRAKQDMLRNAFTRKGIHFKGQHVELSVLEAVFSRGDMDCAALLEAAWKEGCRFDSWSEIFNFDKWLTASEKTGMDLFKYASRTFDINAVLPWEFIDTGVLNEFLKSEYQKALHGEITKDCRHVCCVCGLDCHTETASAPFVPPVNKPGSIPQKVTTEKIRVKFSKTGMIKYISHSEVITALLRSIRRANIPLTYSEGFHPHPKISFGPPLPLGVEGINEYFDIELPASINPYEIPSSVNTSLPPGLAILAAVPVEKNSESLNDFISRYEYEIIIDKNIHEAINSFLSLPHCFVTRGDKIVDIRQMVEKAETDGVYLNLVLVDMNSAKVRLYELLSNIFQRQVEEIQMLQIRRVNLSGYSKEGWLDPMEGEKIWLTR